MHILFTIIGLVFLVLDLKKPSILKMTFAYTSLFIAIVAFKFGNFYYEIIGFFAFFPIFYLLIKSVIKKERKNKEKLQSLDDFKGKTAIVKKDIGKTLSIDGLGFVEYNNDLWSAKSVDDKEIKAGNKVVIVSRENMILNVRIIDNADK